MTGTMKKIDAQGFGIIDGADGSKVPFIPSAVYKSSCSRTGTKSNFLCRQSQRPGVCRERHCGGRTTQLV